MAAGEGTGCGRGIVGAVREPPLRWMVFWVFCGDGVCVLVVGHPLRARFACTRPPRFAKGRDQIPTRLFPMTWGLIRFCGGLPFRTRRASWAVRRSSSMVEAWEKKAVWGVMMMLGACRSG